MLLLTSLPLCQLITSVGIHAGSMLDNLIATVQLRHCSRQIKDGRERCNLIAQ